MTPKEKADELYVGFWHITNDSRIAKKCALIAVNEILNSQNAFIQTYLQNRYWQEVKQEIERL